MKINILSSAAVCSLLFLTGCMAYIPSTMSSNQFLGERAVQYTVRQTQQEQTTTDEEGNQETQEARFNLYVRLCNLDNAGKLTGCKQSLILANIDPKVASNHIHWHDQETFYVAYSRLEQLSFFTSYMQPAVKMCKVQSSNAVACSDQDAINRLLTPKAME